MNHCALGSSDGISIKELILKLNNIELSSVLISGLLPIVQVVKSRYRAEAQYNYTTNPQRTKDSASYFLPVALGICSQ